MYIYLRNIIMYMSINKIYNNNINFLHEGYTM